MGYDPVLFERGHIPYGKEQKLEEYCYSEIGGCDIVVVIIGGRFGAQSADSKQSITQKELQTAVTQGKQIYVFVQKDVLAEYRTWQSNKDLKDFKPAAANDVRVYKFLEEIYGLPFGNPVEGFELATDIVRFLQEQWAGLFQRLLSQGARQKEIDIIDGLNTTASTLKNLVTYLSETREKGDQAIKDILLSSHPAFVQVKKFLGMHYRVVFYNLKELDALAKARGYKRDDKDGKEGFYHWDNADQKNGFRIFKKVFDADEKLKAMKPEDWKEDYFEDYTIEPKTTDPDEVPF
jgi:hypothetical protein